MIKLQDVPPSEIESESFKIIEAEFEEQTGMVPDMFSAEEFKVLQRIIHATGDFGVADSLVFQGDPISAARESIRKGCNILTDVNMVASGISKKILAGFGGKVVCRVAEPETASMAKELAITRSEAAMRRSTEDNIGLVAVGNAPTALISTIRLIEEGLFSPAVIIGVPVGFVNAAESKEILKEKSIPAITLTGRRGGSPIAAAAVNAILKMV